MQSESNDVPEVFLVEQHLATDGSLAQIEALNGVDQEGGEALFLRVLFLYHSHSVQSAPNLFFHIWFSSFDFKHIHQSLIGKHWLAPNLLRVALQVSLFLRPVLEP
jgi:hypothetical protein